MALATMLRRALPLAFMSPRLPQIAAISTTTTPCRRNQRLTAHFSRAIGISQIQQLSTAIAEEEPIADKNLIGVMEKEIDKAPEFPLGLPDGFPFKIIQDNPISSLVVLQRTTSGGEVVTIVADTAEIWTTSPLSFPLVATVTKPNGQQLKFDVLYRLEDCELWLSHVKYSVSPASDEDEYIRIHASQPSDKDFQASIEAIEINTGVTLSGLSEKAFHKYLEAREIKPGTTLTFLFDYMKNKAERDCSIWFNKFKNFVPN